MPAESLFKYSGPDWLLILLASINNDRRGLVLMTLWRCWHLRNDVVHEKGTCSVDGSVNFLNRYLRELNISCSVSTSRKGKEPILCKESLADTKLDLTANNVKMFQAGKWKAPDEGWIC
jgi:hypothetical protein